MADFTLFTEFHISTFKQMLTMLGRTCYFPMPRDECVGEGTSVSDL